MSRELYIYGYDRTLAPLSDLAEAAAAVGWTFRSFKDFDSMEASSDSVVRDCDLVGWREDSPHAAEIEEAFRKRDSGAIEGLYAQEEIATTAVMLERELLG